MNSRTRSGRRPVPVAPLLLALASGCGTLPDGKRWGEEATLTPSLGRVGRAALRALLEPGTWIPAAGAIVFSVHSLDRQVSDQLSQQTPIFGDQETARDVSDAIPVALAGGVAGTALATPGGEGGGEWWVDKGKGLGVEIGAIGVTAGVTEVLKVGVGRERPNGNNQESFPSGHTSFSFACATEISRNAEKLAIPAAGRFAIQASSYTLAGVVGWARVESQDHFPSDVFAGAAIGHFFGAFIHDAFLGLPEKGFPEVAIEPLRDGALIEVGFKF